jgi:hypothetical protein
MGVGWRESGQNVRSAAYAACLAVLPTPFARPKNRFPVGMKSAKDQSADSQAWKCNKGGPNERSRSFRLAEDRVFVPMNFMGTRNDGARKCPRHRMRAEATGSSARGESWRGIICRRASAAGSGAGRSLHGGNDSHRIRAANGARKSSAILYKPKSSPTAVSGIGAWFRSLAAEPYGW